jgi:hypothetical protein
MGRHFAYSCPIRLHSDRLTIARQSVWFSQAWERGGTSHQRKNVGRHRYQIIVSGRLGKVTSEIFDDMSIEYDGTNTGLTAELDQAALYGVLNRIPAFGLELVALNRLNDRPS